MNENIIKIYDNNGSDEEYQVLAVLKKEFDYIIYTDLNNDNIKKNIQAIKVSSNNNNEVIPINKKEWQMLEQEYLNLIEH